ncbi:MAG: hypothetical protein BAJATHORv1_60074 [Candidatus Thorarchaeota archaeon]|nr:MAG: hypothetical protein BAJATHORv1_60074 [Candidatus Thorarchaeota archaeon]
MEYTNETSIHVTYPIVGALLAAEMFIEKNERVEKWNPKSDIQRHFMNDFYEKCKSEIPKIPEIESIADRDVSVINAWLKEHGFDIQLSPIPPSGLAAACKLDVTGFWHTTGMSSELLGYDDAVYPCVNMMQGYNLLDSEVVEEHVVRIPTESSDEVFMVMVDKAPSGFDMIEYAQKIQDSLKPCNHEYAGLRFPMIDLDLEGSLDWLIGLKVDIASSDISYYKIAEALQQTKLKMNHKGFRIKSAAAIGILKAAAPRRTEPYVINRPFLMWIQRPSLAKPLTVGYFNTDVWKNPSGLEM